jgi:DNA-binding Xre family transcriptional regulator
MAGRRLGYRWRLREVMAARELWHTTELRPLLVERGIDLSPAQVHRLVTQTPERLSLRTLMALCDALDCELVDLLERVAEAPAQKQRRAAGGGDGGDGDVLPLQPKPARIAPRRPPR